MAAKVITSAPPSGGGAPLGVPDTSAMTPAQIAYYLRTGKWMKEGADGGGTADGSSSDGADGSGGSDGTGGGTDGGTAGGGTDGSGGGDVSSSGQTSVNASNSQAEAAKALGINFGLPLYNGTNAIGQPYSNQLKPGADYLAKRTAQAAYNEGVTNAFTPKGNYMPAWAVQQPAANWLNKGFDTAKYFPGIPGVQANLPAGAGVPRGTNLGFGTLFGSLAPSTQLPGSGAPSETYTSPSIVTGPVTRPPGTTRVVPPPYIGGGGETRVPNTEGVIPREESGPAPYNPGNVFTSPIQNVTGTSTVAQSMGRNYYNPQTFEHSIEALPPELAGAYIPPQYIGHALPAGAFKSLWPNSVGTDWVKVKPEGWSVTWRPTNTRG